jgi:predicted secreted Zn-dependent protease
METKIPEQEHKKWSLYQEQLQDHEAVHVQLIRRFIEETAREIESQFGLKVRLYAHTDHKIRQTELVSPDVEQFMQHRLQKLYAQQVEFDTLSKHGRIVATDEMLKQLS